ncbi:MAG: tetratricopeptide repeat protein [Fimbriimonas sp.]
MLKGIGNLHFPVTSKVPLAQRYFDQALTLHYAFNHAEALRSFKEVIRHDPDCAMAYWGAGLTLGSNINAKMDPATGPQAFEYLRVAREKAPKASAREQAYIKALSTRYAERPPDDRTPLDAAYADAMRALFKAYPNDPDAGALLTESLMVLHPWDYWTRPGDPKPWAGEIVESIEKTLAMAPFHPGALHWHIHAVEASRNPGAALLSADRLRDLVPTAGHLVHMPSHTYIRVGRYADASTANELAMKADADYLDQCRAQGMYPALYVPHNSHFLVITAAIEGRSKASLEAARQVKAHIESMPMEPTVGGPQHFALMPLFSLVRFGRWTEIRAYPAPKANFPYMQAIWNYARGMAEARTGHPEAAERHLAKLAAIAKEPRMVWIAPSSVDGKPSLLEIARDVLEGEIRATQGKHDQAISLLKRAVQTEDSLTFEEPPAWFFAVRHSLGAVLLQAKRASEAETIYREDLERYPVNGWGLVGLSNAQRAQGKAFEADQTMAQFRTAWRRADVKITGSRF